jgi:uncharacterized membrane protein
VVRVVIRAGARIALGLFLLLAGTAHLTVARVAFRAQVPSWLPIDADLVVLVSGVVEIVLGLALVLLVRRRVTVGLVVAAFFVAVFPGNIAQFVEQRPAFGLDTDLARGLRLLGQPFLVAWALWSTGAWTWLLAVSGSRRSTRRAGPSR